MVQGIENASCVPIFATQFFISAGSFPYNIYIFLLQYHSNFFSAIFFLKFEKYFLIGSR